jgi:NAD(P) transhydrogenase subunit alpha
LKIVVPRELRDGETRVALVPESAKKLIAKGAQVVVQSDAGIRAGFPDAAYLEAGAVIEQDRGGMLGTADFILGVQPPLPSDVSAMKPEAMLLTTLLPTKNIETVRALAARRVSAFATDAIPRTTRAQSMDTLSSMANIAGYKSVLIAANECARYFPMFMTAAGTVFAAKVFVIGAGVAGLQAIATAKRLGAQVEATDTRAAVKEQIESLGAKWAGVQTSEDAQTAAGYAKELSAEFQQKQAALISDKCAAADAVITTALIGGVKAPRLITAAMVARMKPGSVIVDLAAEAGGNCELTRPGEMVIHNGVKICGPVNLPATMPYHGSTLYSRNLTTFLLEFMKEGQFRLDLSDDIQAAALITHQGDVRHAGARAALGLA